MKKNLTLPLVITGFLATAALAGALEVSGTLGVGFSAGGDMVEMTVTEDGGHHVTAVEQAYPSLGSGFKLDADVTYFLNSNFGVMAGIGMSMLGGYERTEHQITSTGTIETRKVEISSSYVPINIGAKLTSAFGRMRPYVIFAPGIYLPVGVESREHTPTETQVSELHFDAGLGFCAAGGCLYSLGNNLSIRAELSANYAFAAVNEMVVTTTPAATGVTELPVIQPFANDRANYPGKPQFSFSSVGLKVGVAKAF